MVKASSQFIIEAKWWYSHLVEKDERSNVALYDNRSKELLWGKGIEKKKNWVKKRKKKLGKRKLGSNFLPILDQ